MKLEIVLVVEANDDYVAEELKKFAEQVQREGASAWKEHPALRPLGVVVRNITNPQPEVLFEAAL